MPNYEYQCDGCGYQFEKFFKIDKHKKQTECESCGNIANQLINDNLEVTFDVKGTGNVELQNTGIASVDYNWDQIIGKDAEEKRKYLEGRDSYKRGKLRERPAAIERDLVRTIDGDYFIWDVNGKRKSGAIRTLVEKSKRK